MPLTKVQSGMIGSVDATTLTGVVPAANGGTGGTNGAIGFKNRWINGNMAINQRGGTVTATGSEPYSLDRWKGADATSGVFTMQQASDAPTGSGFQYSLQATVTTATASIAAGDYAFLRQIIEGFNSVDLAWGTASAKTITVSFWVKSSVTGTYSFTVINEATTQSYPATYTINAANTWEFKTITIPGSTTGIWGSTNGIGIYCDFSLATGSSYTRTPNTWSGSLALGATGQVNWLLTNGNTFYLTGCQFEVGSAATNFDVRSITTELQLCQRYCNIFYGGTYGSFMVNGSTFAFNIPMPVSMRTQPSFTTNINDSNFVIGSPNSSQWAMYIQNSGWNSYSGSINTLSMNSTPTTQSWIQLGTYSCTLNAFTAFLLGSTRYFSFTAEL